jgi:phthiocerol/phenolphthiocerol synthesis type-I polyketide synthase E
MIMENSIEQQHDNQDQLPEELAVAVIGMSGVFPGASDVKAFWQNLASGTESITTFEKQQLLDKGVDSDLLDNASYVKAASFIEDVEWFDADFFDMTPREAEITDPQHRVLLECAHEALENAGYVGENYDGAIAVYAGVGLNTYLLSNIMPNTQLLQSMGMHQLLLGNDKCYATSRIAYKLNLKGACISLDTACSSSLVSIITAYKSLIAYDCDMALAGGAKVNSQDVGYLYEPGSINSPDGHCRSFDAEANGTVFGSGAGMVLLKRLEDAVEDKDNILGIIRGGAINNDGADKVGFTAPGVNGQRNVIEQALMFSEVPADSISYVEAHGTGTRLGDPVELSALSEAFEGAENQSCYIGSSKSNIGHLESAAGVTGLIKVLSSLQHELLPPSLNFNNPNPNIDFANSPFKVVDKATAWPRTGTARRACVSSFGLGGTNAHLVVEESPIREIDNSQTSELMVISTKCTTALNQAKQRINAAMQADDAPLLKDAAYTLAVGRKKYDQRSFAVASSSGQPMTFAPAINAEQPVQNVAWVVPGQGNQHLGMSRHLYNRFEIFKTTVDDCCDILAGLGNSSLKGLLLADQPDEHLSEQLNNTVNAQPAIFVHAYAMAKQLQAWGLEPDLMLGHSIGEYVVACLAQALTLKDALRLVHTRGQLMSKVEPGSMAVVLSTLAEVNTIINNTTLDIAAINGPRSIVVSGENAQIDQLLQSAKDSGIDARKLVTSHAFHSHMMQPVLSEFKAVVSQLTFAPLQKSYVSSATGKLATDEQISNPDYWVNHLRQAVQFADAVKTLVSEGVDCVMDLGPSTSASMLVRDNVGVQKTVAIINCAANVKQQTPADEVLLAAVGQLWCHGLNIDWSLLYQGRDCYRAALPGYPLQKQRLWIDPVIVDPTSADHAQVQSVVSAAIEQARNDESQDFEGAPRNDMEQMIAAIWQELLGLEQITVSDNFFTLGGQSLLATRVMSSIYEQTNIELDVSVIFDAPTIEGLSLALMEQQMLSSDDAELEQLLAQMEA